MPHLDIPAVADLFVLVRLASKLRNLGHDRNVRGKGWLAIYEAYSVPRSLWDVQYFSVVPVLFKTCCT